MTFEWPCPTYACKGLLRTEAVPMSGTVATCEPDPDGPGAFCAREMRWNRRAEGWEPTGPIQGFSR